MAGACCAGERAKRAGAHFMKGVGPGKHTAHLRTAKAKQTACCPDRAAQDLAFLWRTLWEAQQPARQVRQVRLRCHREK